MLQVLRQNKLTMSFSIVSGRGIGYSVFIFGQLLNEAFILARLEQNHIPLAKPHRIGILHQTVKLLKD